MSRQVSKMPVHPHVHGERTSDRPRDRFIAGSSPRTWGTPYGITYHSSLSRFIPTYMGNACGTFGTGAFRAVHPHVHGERSRQPRHGCRPHGSSPRTWGTRLGAIRTPELRRFIPTYMGNALLPNRRRHLSPVHPHVHGERIPDSAPLSNRVGSSPRTWGTL